MNRLLGQADDGVGIGRGLSSVPAGLQRVISGFRQGEIILCLRYTSGEQIFCSFELGGNDGPYSFRRIT
jgi:hypothetical protein